jgi:hypothetical protein
MARKRKKSLEKTVREVLGDETRLKELKPSELFRLLQLHRESKQVGGEQRPKEITIRWVEPEEEQ